MGDSKTFAEVESIAVLVMLHVYLEDWLTIVGSLIAGLLSSALLLDIAKSGWAWVVASLGRGARASQ